MPKITFIGSGSLGFTRRLITDILSFPELQESDFSLIDIDEKRLDYSLRITRRVLRDGNYPATVEATLDRKKALQGAEYVIITILVGGIEAISLDVDIPMKYGVDQCIGDTLGPGGVLRGIRTIPVILEICRDIEDVCPTAIVFNYTNPMAMLCWAMNEATSVKNVGLCHSVQGTAKELAHYIQASPEEISYWVAGINHQSWFLEFKWNGKDAYPLLREKMKDAEVIRTDPTRFEMFKHLGYFVTESSGHNSEYNPWFRKRKDLLEKYTGKGFNGESRYIKQLYGKDREEWDKELEKLINQKKPLNLERSHEYVAYIIHSLYTGKPCRINGNVQNRGLISNLPYNCCVEVPCLVDKNGIHPCYVGELPPQLAALNRSNIAVQEMAVKAVLEKNIDMVYQAVYFDPLTSAVCSLEEIRRMVDEMLKAEKEWLPKEFQRFV